MSPPTPYFLTCRDPLQVLVKQYIAAHNKGGEFIKVPAAVVVDGERRYGHPLTCDWALGVRELINADPTIMGRAAAAGLTESHLLGFSVFSDKTTIGNNLHAYPVIISEAHSGAKDIHRTFSSGEGVIAYFPIPQKPANSTSQEHTERVCELNAACMREVRLS